MVVVGHTQLRDLTQGELALLPDDERNRDFGSDYRRRQFQCGRALLRLLLQEATGEPAAGFRIETEEAGKPYCTAGQAISITHTRNRVACTVADSGEIGIDIEYIDESRQVSQILERFFSVEERQWIDGKYEHFFMLWVVKEAFVKAHGQSIFGGLEKLRCTVDGAFIKATALQGSFHDLCIYRRGEAFLALATTAAPLESVAFRHWHPSTGILTDDSEYSLIATTNDNARPAAA